MSRTLVHFKVPFPQGWYLDYFPYTKIIAMTPKPPHNVGKVHSLFGATIQPVTEENNQLVVMEFKNDQLDQKCREKLNQIEKEFHSKLEFTECTGYDCKKEWEELTKDPY